MERANVAQCGDKQQATPVLPISKNAVMDGMS
jgi:hypothetical protein